MSGLEIVGVVLGVIPVVVSSIEGYGKLLDGYKKTQKSGLLVTKLARHLRDERVAFEETCTTLLGHSVPVEKIKSLLQDPSGPSWKDDDVQAAVSTRFDCSNEQVFHDTVQEINEVISEFYVQLCLGQDGKAQDDPTASKSKKLKFAFEIARNYSQYETKIETLKGHNEKLSRLLKQSHDNEQIRRYSSKRDVLNLIQGVTNSLFKALQMSISCSCAHLHGVNFQLPMLQITSQSRMIEAIKKQDFRVAIVNGSPQSTPIGPTAWFWKDVLLKWIPGYYESEPGKPPDCLPSPIQLQGPKKDKAPKGVRFSEDPLSISSVVKSRFRSFRASATPAIMLQPSSASSSALTDTSFNSSTHSTAHTSTRSFSSTTSLSSSTTLFQSSSPSSRSPSPATVQGSDIEPSRLGSVKVLDLCHRFASTSVDELSAGKVYGIVADSAGQHPRCFEVVCLDSAISSFSLPDGESPSKKPISTISLNSVLRNRKQRRRAPLIPKKQRIASVVATSILTLHGTPWMPELLTSNDLYFIEKDGKPQLDHVFVSKRPAQEKKTDSKENASAEDREDDDDAIDGIDSLLALGILLAEIALWKPVYDFWDQEKHEITNKADYMNSNNSNHSNHDDGKKAATPTQVISRLQDLLDMSSGPGYERATSLLGRLDALMGRQYRDAAKVCITGGLQVDDGGDDKEGEAAPSLDDAGFRDAVYAAVVAPLQAAARTANERMVIGEREVG